MRHVGVKASLSEDLQLHGTECVAEKQKQED